MEISFTKIGCLLGQPHVDCRPQFLVVSANRKGLISTTVWAANNLYQIDAVMMAICINFEHKLLYIYIHIQVGLQYILIIVQNYLSVWMYRNIYTSIHAAFKYTTFASFWKSSEYIQTGCISISISRQSDKGLWYKLPVLLLQHFYFYTFPSIWGNNTMSMMRLMSYYQQYYVF